MYEYIVKDNKLILKVIKISIHELIITDLYNSILLF